MYIPYMVVGVVCALSTISAYNLPETKGKSIPDTYADAKAQEK